MTDTGRDTGDVDRLAARLEALELTLLEVVTALGMLVGELALREDLALEKPEVVEEALERGWQTLFGSTLEAELAAVPEWANEERLRQIGPGALAAAMDETGAAVGAVYAVGGGSARLVTSAGYPPGVMEQFATIPLDADFPVCAAARTATPLWFSQRT